MAISLTYGAYTNPASSKILEINFTEEMEQTSVSGVIMFWDNTSFATLKTLKDNFSAALQKANQKLTITIDDDGASNIFEYDPAANTGFQTKGTVGFRTMTGRSMDLHFSFSIQRPSFNTTGDFPINTHLSYDDAQRVTAQFTGKYTGYGADTGKVNYEDATTGAVKKAEAILTAYFPTRAFQLTSESRNDKFSTNGVIEYTLQFIEKFITEAYANWDIRNLNVTQLAGDPVGQPQTAGTSGKKLGEPGYAASKYAGTALKPPVKYSVTFDAVFKGDTLKFIGFQTEYETNIKPFLWEHVLTNYMKVGHYNQTTKAYIEADNTNFGSQSNTINVNWTVIAPDDSGVISYSDKISFNYTSRKVREKYLDGVEDTYYSYSPGHKITMSFVATIVRLGNVPNRPAAPGDKPPTAFNYNPEGRWDLDEGSESGEVLARPAIKDGNLVILYTKSFSSSFTWVVDKDMNDKPAAPAATPSNKNVV